MNDERFEKDAMESIQGIFNAILISLPIWGILYVGLRLLHLM